MSEYRVRIVDEAEQDLAEIIDYIASRDSPQRAAHVLDRLLELCERLETHPQRGHIPPELTSLGIKTFREVHFKPYRVIYAIAGRVVVVHVIVDGRRSLQAVLQRRLLR